MTRMWFDGMIAGFDLETTGINPHVDTPVQIGVQVSVTKDGVHTPVPSMSYECYVNPGIEIPNPEIHGITTECVRERGISTRDAIDELMWFLRALTSVSVPIVIYNVAYDWTMLHAHVIRLGIDWDIGEAVLVDPMVIDRQIDKWRKGSRKQADVAKVYGVTFDTSQLHTAAFDADLSVQIARNMGRNYPTLSDIDFTKQQHGWATKQQRELQAYFNSRQNGQIVNLGWPLSTEGSNGQ